VNAPGELAGAVDRLMSDDAARKELGIRGLAQANLRRGATARAGERIVELYEEATPRMPLINPLGIFWRAGVQVDRALTRTQRLEAPVVSVGNLAMGGTGKTPMVLWLAEKLTLAGVRACVLTRGYGRTSRRPLALPAGSRAPIADTGEEPQLLLRSGLVPVGIARNRAAIARQMTEDIRPDVFLLDDGFQHWPLARELDIVLIDSLDPWRGGMPPVGRLREGPSALARAQAIVLTRTLSHRTYSGLVAQIRKANPHAPIFRARVETARPPFAPGEKVGAFCGLAQPETFRATLLSLGCEPVFFQVFSDHHKYSEVELTAMAARAPKLVTTEKDLLNVPERLRGVLPIVSLPVRMVVEDGERLMEIVLAAIRKP
jgi:tetraacyldisaccharide 4'-kinase